MPERTDVEAAIWQGEKKQEEAMGSFGFRNAMRWSGPRRRNRTIRSTRNVPN
ncbi:MAG TPA: hypothetical protein VHM00_15330 [Caldimonas sp.]|jgi:hypothetical protein|nr:hypothetical protein [Caldimonas sp.]HEX2542442.1 hypothetical protein [Caldimonas sp.]